jgi:hypothetical protein
VQHSSLAVETDATQESSPSWTESTIQLAKAGFVSVATISIASGIWRSPTFEFGIAGIFELQLTSLVSWAILSK